nr:SLOG family protein [Alkalicoccobacillus plakortidis]
MKTLLVTGYKPHELGVFDDKHVGIQYIKKAIKRRVTSLIEDGVEWILISGQPGVELWAAESAFELKEMYPELKVAILPPFLEQESQWKEAAQEKYQQVLSEADFVKPITNRVYDSPGTIALEK